MPDLPVCGESMDIFSVEFFSALLAIIAIDLVLAGDNAIVIALVARKLPQHLQRITIIGGTIGAVIVRVGMTLAIVWLLNIPGLLLVGGILLVWIAYKLLTPIRDEKKLEHLPSTNAGLWAAIRTIIVADAVMGIDNVLGVAGAAQGDFLLVILGLLISVPIMIAGSTLILKWVERYPIIIYFGAAILAWTAAKMIIHEPMLKDIISRNELIIWVLYGLVIGGIVASGLLRKVPFKSIRPKEKPASPEVRSHQPLSSNTSQEINMLNILIPVDGSRDALRAVEYVIQYRALHDELMHVNLTNIQPRLPRYVTRFVQPQNIHLFRKERAGKALRSAIDLLDKAGLQYSVYINKGDIAEAIVACARQTHSHKIVMGTTRKNALVRFFQGSIINKVMALTDLPVEVVAKEEATILERFGIPVGVGVGLAFLWLATE
jgi:YjbE family integral membrane protein